MQTRENDGVLRSSSPWRIVLALLLGLYGSSVRGAEEAEPDCPFDDGEAEVFANTHPLDLGRSR